MDGFGDDLTSDLGGFADDQDAGTNVATDVAVDLYFTVAVKIADDLEIAADNRRGRRHGNGFVIRWRFFIGFGKHAALPL